MKSEDNWQCQWSWRPVSSKHLSCEGIEKGWWGEGVPRVAREAGEPRGKASFGKRAGWCWPTGFLGPYCWGTDRRQAGQHRNPRLWDRKWDLQVCGTQMSPFLSCFSVPLHPHLRVWNLAGHIAWEHKQVPLLSKCLITAIYYDIIGQPGLSERLANKKDCLRLGVSSLFVRVLGSHNGKVFSLLVIKNHPWLCLRSKDAEGQHKC